MSKRCPHHRIVKVTLNVHHTPDGWISYRECECGVLVPHVTQERAKYVVQSGGPFSPDYVEVS